MKAGAPRRCACRWQAPSVPATRSSQGSSRVSRKSVRGTRSAGAATAFAEGKFARVGPHLPDRATLDALAAQVELRTFSVAANPLRVTQHQAV